MSDRNVNLFGLGVSLLWVVAVGVAFYWGLWAILNTDTAQAAPSNQLTPVYLVICAPTPQELSVEISQGLRAKPQFSLQGGVSHNGIQYCQAVMGYFDLEQNPPPPTPAVNPYGGGV